MPTKKALAARLSETPQPPLRRGRGLRLSRASKQALELASKPAAAPELAANSAPSAAPELSAASELALVEPAVEAAESATPPIATDAESTEVDATSTPIEATASADLVPPSPERDKRKLLLRKDLLKQSKRLARSQGRKLYQVVESALEEYLQRHGAPE